MNKRKQKKKAYPHAEKVNAFELKAPRWALYVCLGAVGVGLIGTLIFLSLKSSGSVSQDTFDFIYLFILFLMGGLVGTYAWWYEKFILQDGVYTYYKPFLKNQSAHVEEIAYVELITVCSWGTRGYREDYRVRFYGKNGQVLIKFYDDGTFFHNEIFIKSLRSHQIKTKRIEKDIS